MWSALRSVSLVFSNTAFKCVIPRWFTSCVFGARNGGVEKFTKYDSAHSPNVISCPLRSEGRVLLSLASKRSLRMRCASFQSSVPVDSLWR